MMAEHVSNKDGHTQLPGHCRALAPWAMDLDAETRGSGIYYHTRSGSGDYPSGVTQLQY